MWKLAETDEYGRRHKQYEKNRPKELKAVLNNLDTYFKALEAGIKPLQISFGFIHPEQAGVVAIDQKGGGKNLAQTRLYVYPDPPVEILYIITLGDKRSQKTDIATCRIFVAELRKERQEPDNANTAPATEDTENQRQGTTP